VPQPSLQPAIEPGLHDADSPVATEVRDFERPPPRVSETPAEIREVLDDNSLGGYPRFPHPFKHPLRALFWIVRTGFSLAAIFAVLAAIAAIPFASIFVLGYLLEAEARVARTGKLRYGFPLLHRGQRLATIALGVGLWLIPVALVSGMAADATLIDPGSAAAANWQRAKVLLVVFVCVHLCLALARGGSLGCFVRPLKNLLWFLAEVRNRPHWRMMRCEACGEPLKKSADVCTLCNHPTIAVAEREGPEPPPKLSYWERADRKVREFIGDFRVKHHLLLGLRGLVGGLAVLFLPTLLFAAATSSRGPAVLVTLFGGLCLAIVFLYVPFLQARLAAENRLSGMWELRCVRRLFRYAPIAWLIALLLVYVLALPLYLFTIVLPPSDAMWLVTPIFVLSIYPARVVTGWAYGRAVWKQQQGRKPAWWGFRWGSRVMMLALTALYTLFFFFARDIGSHGRLVLFEHHAFFGTALSSVFSLLP
jgi:hypothetical protein